MDTIKEYIESLFKNLPQNEKVLNAKKELLQMMEDKYEELKSEGRSENEAIGTVISEFGNLEELAQELGIGEEVKGKEEKSKKPMISLEAIKQYLADAKKRAMLLAVSTSLILLGVSALVCDVDWKWEHTGLCAFFVFLAFSIGIRKYLSYGFSKWKEIDNEKFCIGASGKAFVKSQHDKKFGGLVSMKTLGTVLCVLCVIPLFMFDDRYNLSGLFWVLSGGVFLKKYVKHTEGFYDKFRRAETGTEGVWFEGVENFQVDNDPTVRRVMIINDIMKTVLVVVVVVLVVIGGVKLYRTVQDGVRTIFNIDGINIEPKGLDHEVTYWGNSGDGITDLSSDFSNINIEGSVMTVSVKNGNSADLKIRYNHRYLMPKVEVENDTLYISQLNKKNYLPKTACEVELTLPDGKSYDDVSIKTSVGEINVCKFNFETGDFNANVGNVEIEGCRFSYVDARTNVGEVLMDIVDSIDDYRVDTFTNVGDILIFGDKYKKSFDNGLKSSGKKIYIESNVGDVMIR